jgi:Fe-Mn family superoxide dismutase
MNTPYQLPDLPYDFSALEPVISSAIMELHYKKHHQAYVTNLNGSLEKYHDAEKKQEIGAMIALQAAIRFNGGGHLNHTLFWKGLAPKGSGGAPSGSLLKQIEKDFGSLAEMETRLDGATVAIQGSGWGWLGYHPIAKRLEIAVTANQDPLSTLGLVPLIGIDVWEHAYYLQYKNVRADYVKAIHQIFNWKEVEKRFAQAAG